jgi:hypothetical protein
VESPAEATTEGAPVETQGGAVETPTETQSETPVEGTSTGGAIEAPAAEAPAN